ncbi:unnamed protein product [Prorocentrum cordatum]|uniref:Dolichol kinase n=1 Tax=Prorocentrum cordatum TaxID=2364126 RepID=A0ABN9TPW6_9DINO|nr:unnamed protein product [Polarella glacialis]
MPPLRARGQGGRGGGGGLLWRVCRLLLLTAVPLAGAAGLLQADPLCLLAVVVASSVAMLLELTGLLRAVGVPFPCVLGLLYLLQLWVLPPSRLATARSARPGRGRTSPPSPALRGWL